MPPSRKPHPYFAHPLIDYGLMGLGSIVVYFWLKARPAVDASQVMAFAVVYLTWVGNAPHFAATSYRLYGSRENRARYPFTAWLVPPFVGAAVLAGLHWPAVFAPALVKLYLLWSPFHYSGQTFGLSLLYLRRSGYAVSPWQRRTLLAFVYGSYLSATIAAEVTGGKSVFFGIEAPGLGLPPWLAPASLGLTWAVGALFLALALGARFRRGARMPLIVLVPPAAQYVWLVLGSGLGSYFTLVPFFHGVQYLLVAWYMELRETGSEGRRAWGQTLKWAVGVGLGGVALFWGLPQGLLLAGYPAALALPLTLIGVQIHHFFVDGVIWKLRHPHVTGRLVGRSAAPAGPLSAAA